MKTKVLLIIWGLIIVGLASYSLLDFDQQQVNNFRIAPNVFYSGQMKDQYFSGHGVLTLKDGSKYEGDFKKGRFDGLGHYTAAAGWQYEGEFVDGKADGRGKLTLANHKTYQGTFKDGSFQK